MPGRFEKAGAAIGRLVDGKNAAYGSAFHKTGGILRVLYPEGIKPEQYGDLLAIVRILDKFFRIATHAQDPLGENPWRDVAGYGILKTEIDQTAEIAPPGQEIPFKPLRADTLNISCPYCSQGISIAIDKTKGKDHGGI